MPVLLKENFNRWYSLRTYYLAITISDLPFQVYFRHLVKLRVKLKTLLFISDYFLCAVRVNCLLFHVTTARTVPIPNVPGSLSSDFICCAKRWISGGSRHECTKRRFPGPSYVSSILIVLWILCVVRCHSDIPSLDHLSVVHSIRFRGHCSGNIFIWSRKTQVPHNLLSFQISNHYVGRVGHDGRKHYTRFCSFNRNFYHFENSGVSILKMEVENTKINNFSQNFFMM